MSVAIFPTYLRACRPPKDWQSPASVFGLLTREGLDIGCLRSPQRKANAWFGQ